EDLCQTRITAGVPAQRNLVELLTLLVHAEDANVPHVVVTAGIHAAGNVQIDLAQVEQVVEVIKATLDGFGDRDRLGIGQRAEIATRAANDVGQQSHIGGGKAQFTQFTPQFEQATLLDIGED